MTAPIQAAQSLPDPHVLDGHYRDHTDKVNGWSERQVLEIIAAKEAEVGRLTQTLSCKQREVVTLRQALTEIAETEFKARPGLTDFGESWDKGLFIGTLKDIARKALKLRSVKVDRAALTQGETK